MNLAMWAERNGVARVTAYRWFHAGVVPVAAGKVGRLIVVEPASGTGPATRTAVYAGVWSAFQTADLERHVARVTAGATAEQIRVDKGVVEVGSALGSALDGHRGRFVVLLGDPRVGRIVVEHRDRLCGLGSEYVEAAVAVQGGELVVVGSAEVDDDVVRDVTEMLTSMCAGLCAKRAAQNPAKPALAAAAAGEVQAA